ncbi:MAG TPA: hypothetical protein PK867_25405 [Pirellulales bacterium]|nr:hypothetical protein [Pirellulales bacterium]
MSKYSYGFPPAAQRDLNELLTRDHTPGGAILFGLGGHVVEMQARAMEVLREPRSLAHVTKISGMAREGVRESLAVTCSNCGRTHQHRHPPAKSGDRPVKWPRSLEARPGNQRLMLGCTFDKGHDGLENDIDETKRQTISHHSFAAAEKANPVCLVWRQILAPRLAAAALA